MSSFGYIRVPLSMETINYLKPKIDHLKEHGFTPSNDIDIPLDKEQFMIREIIDIWGRESFISTGLVVKMTLATTPVKTNPPPKTELDKVMIARSLEHQHREHIHLLSVIYNEIKAQF